MCINLQRLPNPRYRGQRPTSYPSPFGGVNQRYYINNTIMPSATHKIGNKVIIYGAIAKYYHMVMRTVGLVTILRCNKITYAVIAIAELFTELEVACTKPAKKISYILTIKASTMTKCWKAVIGIGESREISSTTSFKHT